jgi:hypothetical protein
MNADHFERSGKKTLTTVRWGEGGGLRKQREKEEKGQGKNILDIGKNKEKNRVKRYKARQEKKGKISSRELENEGAGMKVERAA